MVDVDNGEFEREVGRCCWDARDDADVGLDIVVVNCCGDVRDDADAGLDMVVVRCC